MMLYIFPFNLYTHYLFAGIGLHVIIVSELLWQEENKIRATSETRWSRDPSEQEAETGTLS